MFRKLITIWVLYKWLLSVAIAISAVIGYILTGESELYTLLLLFCGVFFQSAAAAALNQYYERNTDALMERTRKRPIPSGKMTTQSAVIAILVALISGTILLSFVNLYTAGLGLFNLVLYVYVYTPLKYKTHLAIIPGGFVGAIPPLMGWIAAANQHHWYPIVFYATFMFFWQIPHFLLLNYKYAGDYQKAGISTLYTSVSHNVFGLIFFVWFCGTLIISQMFPLVGLIRGITPMLTLLIINIAVFAVFGYLVFGNEGKKIAFGQMLLYGYLLFQMAIIAFSQV